MINEDLACQLNYVIVISDGKMRNHGVPQIPTKKNRKGITKDKVEALREKGVKTLMVAYGDDIDDSGMLIFDYLAMHGSCNAKTLEEAEGRKDCDPTIEAVTPSQLKTKLASKIRQILAEKLAFTAPSITASVQEGVSLYQAQFEYEQYGEWKGTILRKEITGAGSGSVVIHEMSHDGNWDAAKKILSGDYEDPTGGAVHYLNPKIGKKPNWYSKFKKRGVKKIGRHEFGNADNNKKYDGKDYINTRVLESPSPQSRPPGMLARRGLM